MATFYLILVAALLSLTFPLIENAMQFEDPYLFVALRFSIATAILIPFSFKNFTKPIIFSGLLLGLLNFAGYITQTIGLQTVNASRAAFITGANVVFISILAPLFKIQNFKKQDLVCAFVCFFGLYILTGADISGVTMGDFLVLLCAFFVALSIIYISFLSKNNNDPFMLTSSQIMATAFFSWIPCLLFSDFTQIRLTNQSVLTALIYCSLFATILSLFLQMKYQKFVSAQKVGIILCLEPVFATCFDKLINGTELQFSFYLGALLIFASIVLLEWKNQKTDLKDLASESND